MRLLIPFLLVASLFAQAPETVSSASRAAEVVSLGDVMEQLTGAVNALDGAIDQRQRAAMQAPLASIETQLARLVHVTQKLPHPAATRHSIAEMKAAIAGLRKPLEGGLRSDAWDFARLRRACTSCHIRNRKDNERTGMFPNRGAVVTGTLSLFERGGKARQERSGVAVFLEHKDDRPVPIPRMPRISQRGRRFDPAVLVVTVGTTVQFPNDDVVFHNVFSLSRAAAFDLGTYGKGKTKTHTFAKPGLIKVHCNIHSDMAAHVLVLNSARTAVTDEEGFWCIADVPENTYRLRAWHSLADEQRHELRVAGDGIVTKQLQVQETKLRATHRNKHGRKYRKKY